MLRETERILGLIDLLVASEKVPTDLKLFLLDELMGEIVVEVGMKVTHGREDIQMYRMLSEKAIFCDPVRVRHRKSQAHD